MTETFFHDLIDNLPLEHSFSKIRNYLCSNILEKLLSEDVQINEFFSNYYVEIKNIKLNHPEIFPFINIGFCEALVQIIKSMDFSTQKLNEFLNTFQLHLCSSLSELIFIITPQNLEAIFFNLALMVDFFKKTRSFCPELFNGFRKVLAFLKHNFQEIDEKEIFIKWTIFLMNSMFILIANDVNLDVLIREILISMIEISEKISSDNLKKELMACINKIKNASKEAEMKLHLNIFNEKPLMKIKQLTPRIMDEKKKFSNNKAEKENMPLKSRVKDLKKQMKIHSKKIKKQITEENIVSLKNKNLKEDHIV